MESEMPKTAAIRSWIDGNAIRETCTRAVVLRSLMVAVLIGTILNAINQGLELLAGKSVDNLKVLLTYYTCRPYDALVIRAKMSSVIAPSRMRPLTMKAGVPSMFAALASVRAAASE